MDGTTVLVTGAGSGIGRATARAFAAEGATVVVTDLREAAGEETVGLVDDDGGTALFRQLDVRDRERFERVAREAHEAHGGLDVLFNNAGVLRISPFDETDDDERDLQLSVSAIGAWNGCQAAIPLMRERGRGAIVNVASTDAVLGAPSHAAYGMAKAAVLNLTKTLAVEYGPDGIRVNAVCPGPTRSPPMQALFDSHDDPAAAEARVANEHALRAVAEPSEVADVVVFLASDRASHVTGHGLVVDGGYTIQKDQPFDA